MGSTKDVVPIPDDGAVLPAEAVAAISNSDAYSETSAYSKHVDYVDFEIYGKPFTQVVMTLRPETPRLHRGRPIVVVAGEGGSDNGNGFLATYEGREGIGPWLARRGVTFVVVPRLGRWNFFAEGESGSWIDIPLGQRMPVFDRHRAEYWSADDYTSHTSQGQASPTGSDTYRLPKEGSALHDHMLAATPDALVEGYRRGVEFALAALDLPRTEVLLLYWGFSTGGPFLWALARSIAPDGMLGWGTSSTGIAYFHSRIRTGNFDWPYEIRCSGSASGAAPISVSIPNISTTKRANAVAQGAGGAAVQVDRGYDDVLQRRGARRARRTVVDRGFPPAGSAQLRLCGADAQHPGALFPGTRTAGGRGMGDERDARSGHPAGKGRCRRARSWSRIAAATGSRASKVSATTSCTTRSSRSGGSG